jgi:hypothetical protein
MNSGAPVTTGRSFADVTGKNQNADTNVGSQVGPIVIRKVEDHRASDAQLPPNPGPRE